MTGSWNRMAKLSSINPLPSLQQILAKCPCSNPLPLATWRLAEAAYKSGEHDSRLKIGFVRLSEGGKWGGCSAAT